MNEKVIETDTQTFQDASFAVHTIKGGSNNGATLSNTFVVLPGTQEPVTVKYPDLIVDSDEVRIHLSF